MINHVLNPWIILYLYKALNISKNDILLPLHTVYNPPCNR